MGYQRSVNELSGLAAGEVQILSKILEPPRRASQNFEVAESMNKISLALDTVVWIVLCLWLVTLRGTLPTEEHMLFQKRATGSM